MKVKPLGDRVLVEVLEAEEMTKGGIVIPGSAQEKPQQAKVEAVGNGRISDEGKVLPLEVKAGDVILFGKYSGTEINISDEDLLIMRESDILGVIAD